MTPAERRSALESLARERDGVALYEGIATAESNPKLAEVYRRLAAIERRHADSWERALREAGAAVPTPRASFRTRAMVWLARRFGPAFVVPSVTSLEEADRGRYHGVGGGAVPMAADEGSHARVLRQIQGFTRGGLEGGAVAQLEGRHRSAGGNALRAAVLGANDGLVSNLSLVMGVAGAELARGGVLITGLAGLLAGALSMALGEWLSVQSSRELVAHQIAAEKAELEADPEEEMEELALIYEAKGLPRDEALATARRILEDPARAVETLAREELGVDPESLGGSAWEAALTSFVLFAVGAVVPVLPFFWLGGPRGVVTSLAVSALGLFAIGGGTSMFTGQPLLKSGLRMVAFGLAAAGITFGIGRLIGVSLAG
jgi:VIT1/CCC1 family predicted Fe2+/Mn2+ transporter